METAAHTPAFAQTRLRRAFWIFAFCVGVPMMGAVSFAYATGFAERSPHGNLQLGFLAGWCIVLAGIHFLSRFGLMQRRLSIGQDAFETTLAPVGFAAIFAASEIETGASTATNLWNASQMFFLLIIVYFSLYYIIGKITRWLYAKSE